MKFDALTCVAQRFVTNGTNRASNFRFMYRKHLKMARGKGEVENQGLRSHFVERMVKLPMVHVAWDYASNTYTHLKESSKLVNFTLTNAEKSVTFVAGQAKPVVLKFEKQIQAVDELACKGLGTLEEKVPFIKKPADQIIGETRTYYTEAIYSRIEGIKNYGTDKVKNVTDYGLKKAQFILGNRLVQSVLTSLDGTLVLTEKYIDHVLPALKEENQNDVQKEEEASPESRVISRVAHITNKVRHRTYKSLMMKVENFQERCVEILVVYPVVMVEYTKEKKDAMVEFANKLWQAVRQEQAGNDEKEQVVSGHIERQLLHLARLVARQLAMAYTSVSRVPRPQESEVASAPASEQVQASTILDSAQDKVLWVVGMLRTIPSLLPMYIYVFISWLGGKEGANKPNYVIRENGIANKDQANSSNENHANNVNAAQHDKHENSNCTSIPEEHNENSDAEHYQVAAGHHEHH